jgi:hypothetical protein
MAGQGPFGAVGMGGMFSVLKVRADQKRGDYTDPGWYAHPPGTVAYEYAGSLPDPARSEHSGSSSMPRAVPPGEPVEVQIRKPGAHTHGGHR